MSRLLKEGWTSLLVIALPVIALLGGGCRTRGEVGRPQDTAPAPPDATPGNPAVQELLPPLKQGETVESESFDISSGGRFTYRRSVRRPVGRLGAEVRAVDRDAAERLGVEPYQGVLVLSVDQEGPAAVAGLARDDVIISCGGEPIRNLDQFSYSIEETPLKSGVTLEVLRDGMRREIVVEVGSQSRVTASGLITRTLPVVEDLSHSGMVALEVTPEVGQLARRLLGADRGLLVAKVLPGGPAFFSDVQEKDLLIDAGGRPLATTADFTATMNPREHSRVTLTLLRGGERIETDLKLARDANREREFHIPVLFHYESKPQKREVSVLPWGMLFNSRTTYHVKGSSPAEHRTEKKVGFLLDLFRYHSEPENYEFRLLWVLPFRFRTTPLEE